jgi:hypothetical protein
MSVPVFGRLIDLFLVESIVEFFLYGPASFLCSCFPVEVDAAPELPVHLSCQSTAMVWILPEGAPGVHYLD